MRDPTVLSFHLINWSSLTVLAYLCLHNLAQISVGFVSHLHQIFTPKTWLRVWGSLNPKPPACFGLHNSFQLTKAHLLPCLCAFPKEFSLDAFDGIENKIGGGKSRRKYIKEWLARPI
jgi:hypothetical protein